MLWTRNHHGGPAPGLAGRVAVAVALLLAAAGQAHAQHGLGAAKSCSVPQGCVPFTPVCTASSIYVDGYGDAIIIFDAYDLVDPAGESARYPLGGGNLPINQLIGNAVALGPPTPESPLGTFPVLIGPAGSTFESPWFQGHPLPGVGQDGRVQVISSYYEILDDDPDVLAFETVFHWRDQCNSGAIDCDPFLLNMTSASAIVTTLEPAIEIESIPSPSYVCGGQETEVEFTYTIYNTGNADLTDITLGDAACAVESMSEPEGDAGDDGILALAEPYYDANGSGAWEPGEYYVDRNHNGQWDDDEVWTLTCTAVVTGGISDTVTVSGAAAAAPSCVAEWSTERTVEAFPSPGVTVFDDVVFAGDFGLMCALAFGGTPPYTYAWDTGGTGACTPGTEERVYTVVVTDANGCTAEGEGELVILGHPAPRITGDGTECQNWASDFCPVKSDP